MKLKIEEFKTLSFKNTFKILAFLMMTNMSVHARKELIELPDSSPFQRGKAFWLCTEEDYTPAITKFALESPEKRSGILTFTHEEQLGYWYGHLFHLGGLGLFDSHQHASYQSVSRLFKSKSFNEIFSLTHAYMEPRWTIDLEELSVRFYQQTYSWFQHIQNAKFTAEYDKGKDIYFIKDGEQSIAVFKPNERKFNEDDRVSRRPEIQTLCFDLAASMGLQDNVIRAVPYQYDGRLGLIEPYARFFPDSKSRIDFQKKAPTVFKKIKADDPDSIVNYSMMYCDIDESLLPPLTRTAHQSFLFRDPDNFILGRRELISCLSEENIQKTALLAYLLNFHDCHGSNEACIWENGKITSKLFDLEECLLTKTSVVKSIGTTHSMKYLDPQKPTTPFLIDKVLEWNPLVFEYLFQLTNQQNHFPEFAKRLDMARKYLTRHHSFWVLFNQLGMYKIYGTTPADDLQFKPEELETYLSDRRIHYELSPFLYNYEHLKTRLPRRDFDKLIEGDTGKF
jgi:hypothetical protein